MSLDPARTVGSSAGSRRRGLRRLAMHAIALLIVCGNLAVALQPAAVRRAGLRLPRPAWLVDLFLLPGMFSSYSLSNHEFLLSGKRNAEGRSSDRSRWVPLRVREHIPDRHGVAYTRLIAAHHWDVGGRAAQRDAWAFLAQRIRDRHNRLHPDRPIVRVRLGIVEWPQSPLGYRAGQRSGHALARTLFEGPQR